MTGKAIVVTRPKGDEHIITDALHEKSHRVIHEPLTHITLDHTQRTPLQNLLDQEPDAVIVTSRHAVQALAMLTDLRDFFLICVGESTARAAKSLGLCRVSSAGGNVEKLAHFIRDGYDEDSSFVYLSGEHVRADLTELLPEMFIDRLVLYEAIASTQLSDTFIEQLKRGQLDGVTFLSPRAAQLFTALIAKANLQDTVQPLHAFCLSQAIAECLNKHVWAKRHISDEATLASLLECVDNAF